MKASLEGVGGNSGYTPKTWNRDSIMGSHREVLDKNTNIWFCFNFYAYGNLTGLFNLATPDPGALALRQGKNSRVVVARMISN